ncbi:Dabb family protein [Algoriphagus boritolerans]|uniref:Stress responsive A/B Barrel Domain n=1 Tax=Algoriphagus boritolerans DSM 17298 = JCM 18970 TaxID=1120964 RepID=A0A1H6AQG4_9BACT|nr:Dabb family protein [Algoriphagus boritolerans]SEG50440.1 Stress responsive A/B Barrel Domain [Algoriphagus boritolerans DSM 17298 = JCM 18970]
MIRHFGVFQFKKNISESQIEECFRTMKAMVSEIPGLLDMEYGPYNGNEGLNEDFTHGFIMTFDSEESRDEYLHHPIHEKVKELVVPRLERVIVFDIVV